MLRKEYSKILKVLSSETPYNQLSEAEDLIKIAIGQEQGFFEEGRTELASTLLHLRSFHESATFC